MTSEEFAIGTEVWAKIGSFSWWPAKVEAEAELPWFVLKDKPKHGSTIPVFFFGTNEFGWPSIKNVKSYNENHKTLHTKCKSKVFLKALEEIVDKSKWPIKGQFDHAFIEPVVYDSVQEVQDKPKRRKSTSADKPKIEISKKRRATIGNEASKKARTTAAPGDRLLRLRMKLQLFMQQKEEYTEDQYQEASDYLSETEKVEMDIDMFKETKIAKVIKHLSKRDIAIHSISERCRLLTDRWVSELQDGFNILSPTEKNGEDAIKVDSDIFASISTKDANGDGLRSAETKHVETDNIIDQSPNKIKESSLEQAIIAPPLSPSRDSLKSLEREHNSIRSSPQKVADQDNKSPARKNVGAVSPVTSKIAVSAFYSSPKKGDHIISPVKIAALLSPKKALSLLPSSPTKVEDTQALESIKSQIVHEELAKESIEDLHASLDLRSPLKSSNASIVMKPVQHLDHISKDECLIVPLSPKK